MSLQPYPYPAPPTHHPKRRTILLVEDEPFVREATGCILTSAGFDVLVAEDAAAALQIYEALQRSWDRPSEPAIELLMTDMVLPGQTGEQLGEELRRRFPNLKVLVTSGYSDAESTLERPHAHTYFLAKPYSRCELVEKIAEIFEEVPLHRVVGQAG